VQILEQRPNASRVVVALHGFTQGPSSWTEVARKLPPSIALWAAALPGHGTAAPDPRTLSFEDAVGDLVRLIREHANDGPIDLVGYSMGARFALAVAIRAPDVIRRAILVGVNPGIEDDAARASRRVDDSRFIALLRTGGLDPFLEAWEAQPILRIFGTPAKAALELQRSIRSSHDPLALACALERYGLAEMPSFWGRIERVTVPLVLVAGEHDAKFRAIADRIRACCGRAELQMVRGSGHNVVLEAPDGVAAIIAGTSPQSFSSADE
jgi:2-succinyl-6-hydroxy-2,4-cyclohexadiene-1-carboxylate synthase